MVVFYDLACAWRKQVLAQVAISRDKKSSFSHRYSLDDVRYEKNAPTSRHVHHQGAEAAKRDAKPARTSQSPQRRKPSPRSGSGPARHEGSHAVRKGSGQPSARAHQPKRRVNSGSIRAIADQASSKGLHDGGKHGHGSAFPGDSKGFAPASSSTSRRLAGHEASPKRFAQASPRQVRTQAPAQKLAVEPSTRARATSQSAGGFYLAHLRLMVPVTIVLVLAIGFGVFDAVSSWGKIHPGVSVQGVDVGGLTVDEAASKIESSLSPVIDDMHLIAYDTAETASEDGMEVDDTTNEGVAWAASSSGSGLDLNGDGTKDKWRLNKSTLGVSVDGQALAQEAYREGREGNLIAARFSLWVSGKQLFATVSCNDELFNQVLSEMNSALGTKVKNSKAKISDGAATLSAGHDGVEVDRDRFVAKLSSAIFNEANHNFTIPLHDVARSIGDDAAQRVVDKINEALSADVTIAYEDDSWTMDADDLSSVVSQKVLAPGEVLVFANSSQEVQRQSDGAVSDYDVSYGLDTTTGYTLQPYVNQKKLDKYLVKILGDKATGGAKNARFKTNLKKGTVKVVASKNGNGPDRASAEVTVQNILFGTQSSDRTVTITTTTVEPELTTEEAEAMGIKTKLSTWSVALSADDSASRIKNIKLLCKLINNTLTAPGDTWSFNQTTGERTEEKGFETAPTIVNGRHEDELGGGICQVATCVFNCACYAGLGIGTRANHAFYISAYDDRGFADATVSWETPDLQWVNDTQNYILLTAQAEAGGYVTVTFWGTDEGRQVTCDRGKWKKGDKYKTIRENDDTLAKGQTKVEQTGVNGRSIVIHYIAKDKDGNTLHDIEFNSDYQAQNEIIKVGTKTSESDSSSESSADSSSSDSSSESS